LRLELGDQETGQICQISLLHATISLGIKAGRYCF
jgi:hypothetical protein